MGTLYLVATPIGNLDDITLRALQTLQEVPLIACEDTRHTLKLLTHYGLRKRLVSLHAHNEERQLHTLLSHLRTQDLALVSDAGTPGVSDPGVRLVAAAVAEGLAVVPVPGPTAPVAALAGSGLPTNQFTFLGFLPRRRGELERLFKDYRSGAPTLIFFESPHRIEKTLAIIEAVLGDRWLVIARELTKTHEEFLRGPAAVLRAHLRARPARGELTVVMAGSDWKQTR
jgi:16S rRNA (cytidine1402-2'-O)-methyltransferase